MPGGSDTAGLLDQTLEYKMTVKYIISVDVHAKPGFSLFPNKRDLQVSGDHRNPAEESWSTSLSRWGLHRDTNRIPPGRHKLNLMSQDGSQKKDS